MQMLWGTSPTKEVTKSVCDCQNQRTYPGQHVCCASELENVRLSFSHQEKTVVIETLYQTFTSSTVIHFCLLREIIPRILKPTAIGTTNSHTPYK